MDFILFLKALSQSILYTVIATNIPTIALNKLSIYKTSKYDGKIIRKNSVMNSYNMNNLKENLDNKKIELLLPFLEKLKNYTSEEKLETVYKNLESITIKNNPLMLVRGVFGKYNSKKNIIEYSLSSAIGHEFLHLSSSYYDSKNNISFSGFRQQKDIASIGGGLNEGYTELLASRIYNKKEKITAYKKEVKIAKLLELFFDNPKDMEKLYFNYNLPGFIHYMEQFATREEIINLILDIDNMRFLSLGMANPIPTYNYIKIQLTLHKWFINKNNDLKKIEEFRKLIIENKIISFILNNEKIKLHKQNKLDQNKAK